MRKVLIIGSDFAPSSLPSALRVRFFAQHLSDFGWEPTLITVAPEYYETAIDPENEQLIPNWLKLIRTSAIDLRVARRFGIGDIGIRTLWHHWKEASTLCAAENFDAVFIPVPPYMPMVLGRLIRRRFGIPYVIDYIDPWVSEYYWHVPRKMRPPKWPLAYALSRVCEPFALRDVGGITGVSKGTIDGVKDRYPWMKSIPTAEIPYGAEPGDFEYLAVHPRRHGIFDPQDGLCHVSYIGACIPQMHAAVRAILEAVRSGLETSPLMFSRLRLHFIGSSYAPPGASPIAHVAAMAQEMGISHVVEERPARVPYLDSLQLLLDSQALLLIGSEEPHYTASKVFPYILAGRPVLAVFNKESSVVGILKNTATGRVVTFDRTHPPSAGVDEIVGCLKDILNAPNQPAAERVKDFEKYTTRAMAARLADLFDRVARPVSNPQEALV